MRCAVMGQHPLRFPWGFDEEDASCAKMKMELAQQIMVLCQEGVSQFLVACDCGVGLYAAEIVNGLRATTDHDLMLICYTPHEEQATKWAPYLRERYFDMLTAYTGLRLGELCGLQWQDVDVGAGLLHIQRTVERIAQIGGGTCLTVQPPKTENSERWIPIPKEMLRMLKPETKQPDSYLLTGGEIVPDPRAMQYRYKVLLERCGVRYRNFHCLRHSYATRCVERGVDVKSVSELLGHADVRTTLRLYVHSSMDYKRRAVEGIGFLKGIT